MRIIGWETSFSSHSSSINEAIELVERTPQSLLPSATARSEAMLLRRGRQLRSPFSDQRPAGDNDRRNQKTNNKVDAKRISLRGIPIDALTEKEVVDRIISDWQRGRGGWVV